MFTVCWGTAQGRRFEVNQLFTIYNHFIWGKALKLFHVLTEEKALFSLFYILVKTNDCQGQVNVKN